MPLAQLINPQSMAERRETGGLVILDCRFALEDPDYGRCSYAEGHIDGAQYADLERHLSGPVIKGVTGRHPLPEPDTFARQLRAWGISADTDVVLYDDGPGAYAARAWWLLAWLGKRDGVFILDGGLKAWHSAGFPLSLDAPTIEPGTFVGKPDNHLLLDAEHLQKRLGQPGMTLIDARAPARFRGEVEPIDPIAGHIPGAQCAAFNFETPAARAVTRRIVDVEGRCGCSSAHSQHHSVHGTVTHRERQYLCQNQKNDRKRQLPFKKHTKIH